MMALPDLFRRMLLAGRRATLLVAMSVVLVLPSVSAGADAAIYDYDGTPAFAVDGPPAGLSGSEGSSASRLSGPRVDPVEARARLVAEFVAPNTSGLDWDAVVKKSTGETRYEHVTMHNVPNINKKSHGVFYDDAVGTTNDAWARAQQSDLSPLTTDGVDIYTVPMGRDVGFAGGADANALAGVPHTSVEIIVQSGTNNNITAYPVPGP